MGRPILFSKVILLTAFIPLYTCNGSRAAFSSPMAWTLTFALIAGTVFAMWWCRRWPPSPSGENAGDESWIVRWLLRIYRPALDFAMKSRWLIFAAPLLLLARRGGLPFCGQRIFAQAG
jgi:Cu/Ag efflux pump CusA